MPQIAQLAATYSSQIFWLLVTFGFVFFVVGLGMVPKVQATVDARERRIVDDLAAAEAAQRAAEESENSYRARLEANRAEASRLTAAARAEAAVATEGRLVETESALADRVSAAEVRIREASQAALGEIETVAAESARQIVSRIAGLEVEAADAARAVRTVLA